MRLTICLFVASLLGLLATLFIINTSDTESINQSATGDTNTSQTQVTTPLEQVDSPRVANGSVAPPNKPNIILFMTDDQGWGQTGYNGHEHLQTPVLDQLAATGVQLDNFYVNASVCAPTRYGVLTGLQPTQNGCFTVQECRLEEDTTTIAEVLQAEGYITAHFGKWHLGSLRDMSETSPKEHGFIESYTAPNFFDSEPGVNFYHNGVKEVVDLTGIDTSEFLADKVVDFIDTHADEPLFIVVWFPSPHSPYIAQPEYTTAYRGLSEDKQQMYGEITAMDSAIGSIVDTLEQRDLRNQTLLWFNSDNGTSVRNRNPDLTENGGLQGGKNTLYEGGVRVPALINWPGVVDTQITSEVVSTLDIFATVAAVAGVPDVPVTDGIDVSELLFEQMPLTRTEHYLLYDQDMISASDIPTAAAAVIQYPYKLIRPTSGAEFELYDIATDPTETQDLSQTDRVKAVELQTLLEQWLSAQ